MLNYFVLFRIAWLVRKLNAKDVAYLNFNVTMRHFSHDIQDDEMQSG